MRTNTIRSALAAAGLLALAAAAPAQTVNLAISFDENTAFSTVAPDDGQVSQRNTTPAWSNALAALTAALPANANIDALDYIQPTNIYFSLGEATLLSGTTYKDEDVIRWDGASFSMGALGSAMGIPPSANLDGLDILSEAPGFACSFSLDTDALLTVGGVPNTLVADEDAVRFVAGSGLTVIDFDGSANGVSAANDLRVFSRLSATQYVVSFDSAGVIPGANVVGGAALSYDDADLLTFDTAAGPARFLAAAFLVGSSESIPPAAEIDAAEVKIADLNTPTPTPSPSPSETPSLTPSETPSPTPTASLTASQTASVTPTPSQTASSTPSLTPTPGGSPTSTPTPTPTGTPNSAADWELYD